MTSAFDHLVVAADSLAEGVRWCETVLGHGPAPGGAHPLFGTHNRLLRLDGAEAAYLEVIAVNPAVTPQRPAPQRRWFDLDDPALRARLRDQGPHPIHWVARVNDIEVARHALLRLGIDPGPVITASRETPRGLLQWRITVRDDGRRGFDGALPTLIQWGGMHPAHTLPSVGLALHSLSLTHPQAAALTAALEAIGLAQVPVHPGPARIHLGLRDGARHLNLCTPP